MTTEQYLQHTGMGTAEQIRLSCGLQGLAEAKALVKAGRVEVYKTLRHPAIRWDGPCGGYPQPAIPSMTFYRLVRS